MTEDTKTSKANEDTLNLLHQLIAQDLIKRISSGEATPQELAIAVKYLKDNEVTADITLNRPLQVLENTVTEVKELPFEVEEDEDDTD